MLKKCFAACALAVASAAAHAQWLDIVDSTGSRRTTFETAVIGPGLRFDIGQLRLDLDPGYVAFVTYTFIGAEASWTNLLFGADHAFAFDNRTFAGDFHTDRVTQSGLLDFGFQANASGAPVANGDNNRFSAANFGIALDAGGLSGLLLFDDGGAGLDADYDDMLVRFNIGIQPIPEPTALMLLLVGLAGVGVYVRSSRRNGRGSARSAH